MSSTLDTVASDLVPKVPPTSGISLSAITDEGATAEALAAFFKLTDAIISVLNSPTMLAARKSADVQAVLARWDEDLLKAQKTGDITQVDQESSG